MHMVEQANDDDGEVFGVEAKRIENEVEWQWVRTARRVRCGWWRRDDYNTKMVVKEAENVWFQGERLTT
jgi:hypothetical protein